MRHSDALPGAAASGREDEVSDEGMNVEVYHRLRLAGMPHAWAIMAAEDVMRFGAAPLAARQADATVKECRCPYICGVHMGRAPADQATASTGGVRDEA